MSSEDEEKDEESLAESAYRPPWIPLGIILCVELCERLTYYTLASSQKTYLNKQLGESASSAASTNSVFSMLCYMWCLPGGLLADTYGRYKVIVGLASIYALGTILVAISANAELQISWKFVFTVGSLGLIPLGTGGIKPNICNFGADQIGDSTQKQRDAQKSFFSFFYLSINVGVLIAFGFLVNITTNGLPKRGVPIEDGYFFAYVVAACSMVIAILMFVGGTGSYDIQPGGGIDGFVTMVKSISNAVTKGKSWQAYVSALGWLLLPIFFATTVMAALHHPPHADAAGATNSTVHHYANAFEEQCATNSTLQAPPARRLSGSPHHGDETLTHIALVLGAVSCVCLVLAHINNKWIGPLPKKDATSFTVEEVRAGFAPMPLIIVMNLAFNMAYNSMNNAMPAQACQMNTIFLGSQLNGAFFTLGDALSIIILTPIFEFLVYPSVERVLGRPMRLSYKLNAGLFIVACANLVAGIFEIKRRAAPLMCWEETSKCAPNGLHMRDISAFWIFIPNALIGAGEILVNPAMYYFAYTSAPPRVRSMVQAFNLFFSGSVSNAFTAVAMKMAFPDDLDEGHLEYYYFFNVICALAGIVCYFGLRESNAAKDSQETSDSSSSELEDLTVEADSS